MGHFDPQKMKIISNVKTTRGIQTLIGLLLIATEA